MNIVSRYFLLAVECVVFGPTYGYINFLTRLPEPVHPEILWGLITKKWHPAIEFLRRHYPPAVMCRVLLYGKMRQAHITGISSHYDVSNEFYKLMLDKKYMFYSCADFHSHGDTLEQAQTNKANFILGLIEPQTGDRILELGCGWGAMLKAIEQQTGDRENLYGYTLSKEQLEFNREQNGYNVELKNFITTDYDENEFDCIYSIGAWEHVRPSEIPSLLGKLHTALKPNGRLVKHFFCLHADGTAVSALASQLFFPGSELSSYRFHVRQFEAAGFEIERHSIHDYRATLRAWYDNLVRNREEAIRIAGVRNFNRYMVFLASAWRFFEDGEATVMRFRLRKATSHS